MYDPLGYTERIAKAFTSIANEKKEKRKKELKGVGCRSLQNIVNHERILQALYYFIGWDIILPKCNIGKFAVTQAGSNIQVDC